MRENTTQQKYLLHSFIKYDIVHLGLSLISTEPRLSFNGCAETRLTQRKTQHFSTYFWETRLVLLHRSVSQTNASTVSDCPNETRVHHILFQCHSRKHVAAIKK